MNILYVYDGEWPEGATRVAKQTRALAAAGHNVLLLVRNERKRARIESNSWMTIRRLPTVPGRVFNRVLNFPYFFNPFWLFAILSAARSHRAHSIVVCDLPLAPTAVWVARLLRMPVRYDMAEVYPEFLRDQWQFDIMRWSDHIVRNPKAAELLERYVLRRTDTVFVVSQESAERCYRLGVPEERVVIVGNTPEVARADSPKMDTPQDIRHLIGRPIILFVGILIGDRGVKVAVEAAALLARSQRDIALVVVGDGPDRPRLEAIVAEKGLEDSVRLVGWRDHSTLSSYYAAATIGLIPFMDGRHVRITLANKQFDYMAAGLPIVASDLTPIRRIIEETNSGKVVPAGDARALAEAIEALLSDRASLAELGRNGRAAILTKYNWEQDADRFLREFTEDGSAVDPGRLVEA